MNSSKDFNGYPQNNTNINKDYIHITNPPEQQKPFIAPISITQTGIAEIPPATKVSIGGIIVGDNLNITEKGKLSVDLNINNITQEENNYFILDCGSSTRNI